MNTHNLLNRSGETQIWPVFRGKKEKRGQVWSSWTRVRWMHDSSGIFSRFKSPGYIAGKLPEKTHGKSNNIADLTRVKFNALPLSQSSYYHILQVASRNVFDKILADQANPKK